MIKTYTNFPVGRVRGIEFLGGLTSALHFVGNEPLDELDDLIVLAVDHDKGLGNLVNLRGPHDGADRGGKRRVGGEEFAQLVVLRVAHEKVIESVKIVRAQFCLNRKRAREFEKGLKRQEKIRILYRQLGIKGDGKSEIGGKDPACLAHLRGRERGWRGG